MHGTFNELFMGKLQRDGFDSSLLDYDAQVITHQGRTLVGYFDEVARLVGDTNEAKN